MLDTGTYSSPAAVEDVAIRDPMNVWYDVSWVRNDQIAYDVPDTSNRPVLFSPSLVPAIRHPLIVERGSDLTERLLANRFYTYADFTSVLERDAINVVAGRLARKDFWCSLPAHVYLGAGRIYTDEAFHAQESDEIIAAVARSTKIEPRHLHRPRFMKMLESLCSGMDTTTQKIALIGFSTVSETLISSILDFIPNDPLVAPSVRGFVREHARDEGRHHIFFSDVLAYGWPRLAKANQDVLGPLLPRFVRWFLEPDLQWLTSFLQEEGFSPQQIERIVGESYVESEVSESIRLAARHSIDLFNEVGVFESDEAREAFSTLDLI